MFDSSIHWNMIEKEDLDLVDLRNNATLIWCGYVLHCLGENKL